MKTVPILITIFVSVIVTTLGISASDMLEGKSGSLLGQLIGIDESVCPVGMTQVEAALTFTCVDTYEASPAPGCVYPNPASAVETTANREDVDCMSVSQSGVTPWRFVTRDDAQLFCTRSGKRLPTAAEWFQVGIGTPPSGCNISSNVLFPAGKQSSCISAANIFDAVGNVWEWTSDDVIEGEYQGRKLPNSGYVTQIDVGGIATESAEGGAEASFDNDYIWTNQMGSFGIIRGGFYGSGSDGGVYAVQATTKSSFSSSALGFRCIK
jgi:Sulfatase-modifying factor enzyme 1